MADFKRQRLDLGRQLVRSAARVITVVILFRLKGKPRFFPFTGFQYHYAEVTSPKLRRETTTPKYAQDREALMPAHILRGMLGGVVFLVLPTGPATD